MVEQENKRICDMNKEKKKGVNREVRKQRRTTLGGHSKPKPGKEKRTSQDHTPVLLLAAAEEPKGALS